MKAHNITYNYWYLLSLCSLICLYSSQIFAQDTKLKAEVKLSFTEDEDVKVINAVAIDDKGNPIEELDLSFYVQRSFSLLPFGDVFNTTDETGQVTVEFPNDLPGDDQGKVTIIVKIIESDIYEDLTLQVDKNWGLVTELAAEDEKRSLWAAGANAPWTLVIITSSMIFAAWFIYWYVIHLLVKISKVKPLKS